MAKTDSKPYGPLYRAVWRWHFYAGLVTAPFLLILAITGAIYLFNDEINDLAYPHLRFVAPVTEQVTMGEMVETAMAHLPGAIVTRIDTPATPDRSVQIFMTLPDGGNRRVFVDPHTAALLGDLDYGGTLVGIADQMHGSLLMGDAGDAVVELMACWGAVLIVTGLYLWWPSGPMRLRGFLYPRLTAGGRALLRDLHGVVGFWSALLILFLILTGLPWATQWGNMLVGVMDAAGIGYPASHRGYNAPASTPPVTAKQAVGEVPWTLEPTPMPQSAPPEPSGGGHAHHDHGPAIGAAPGGIGIDLVAEILAANGMQWPYRLSTPRGERGVYLAFTYPGQPQGQRSLYIDQYSGQLLREVSYADYGWGAKAVELGVQLHLGNYFGLANQVIMLIPCLGILALSVTGPWMWWKRRPKGRMGVPTVPGPAKLRNLVLITLALGLLFPLAGASLLVILITDRMVAGLIQRKAA
ncbi:PepSY domain-containing protein [Niveispirillum sp.]|uniref:PepSY-associated TM helix domain-containing protein n=1 Tax=Niveispirillum sp. TaxID=1917217 RepID=UPI001B446BD1|nr:PepSY domain-containing protein [Niveispirillum sp.]MBP7340515.1 PepSY domain-containing protein [Niveispirillum sp.]